MAKKRSWTKQQLVLAAKKSYSYRQVLKCIGLCEAGGNYAQVKKYLKEYDISIDHFKGKAWNKGMQGIGKPRLKLEEILKRGSNYQSYKLKRRLFQAKLREPKCEMCGWNKQTKDGRIPLELDHVNGDSMDNRLKNLRILCPNCHSLQSTHRGLNKKKKNKG